jgi:hypothetical protein
MMTRVKFVKKVYPDIDIGTQGLCRYFGGDSVWVQLDYHDKFSHAWHKMPKEWFTVVDGGNSFENCAEDTERVDDKNVSLSKVGRPFSVQLRLKSRESRVTTSRTFGFNISSEHMNQMIQRMSGRLYDTFHIEEPIVTDQDGPCDVEPDVEPEVRNPCSEITWPWQVVERREDGSRLWRLES